jgi:predicted secreted Zn-dependent protease
MKKRMLSLLCVLALCLGLLPVTALAAGPNTVYVGGVELVGSSDKIVYATTNENGEVITEGATADNYNIKWDGSTLTLHGATIKKELYASDPPP